MKAMILCAGLGTRLRPYTETLAKPAVPFLNIPLLGYSLYHLESLGLTGLVANTHHLPQTVERAIAACVRDAQPQYPVHFSLEAPEILSSGGGIWRAREWLKSDGDFGVSNGDEVIFFRQGDGFQRMLAHHRQSGALATLLTTMHMDVGVRLNGIRTDVKGKVTALSVRETGTDHFAGVFIFSPRIWPFLQTAYEKCGDVFHIFKDVLGPAITAGEKVMAYRERDLLWLETSDPGAYAASTRRALEWFACGNEYGAEIRQIFKRFKKHYISRGPDADGTERVWLAEGARFNGNRSESSYLLLDENSAIEAPVTVSGFAVVGAGIHLRNGDIENGAKW